MKLSEEHEQFRKAVRQVVENDINPHVDQWEDAKIFPANRSSPSWRRSVHWALSTTRFGGQGADHSYTLVLGEGTRPHRLRRCSYGHRGAGRHGHPALARFGTSG